MPDFDHWLEKVYEAGGDRETLDRLYDDWAQEYDGHLWASGNPYLAITAGMTARHLRSFNATILDAGCGTGNMAQLLHQMGYSHLEGLDPCEGMLAVAQRKGIYKALHKLVLAEQVELPDESFDAVVAAGVFTQGHAPPESLDGIVKLVKPGGIIVFSLTEPAYNDLGFKEKMIELEASGLWTERERSRRFRSFPFSEKEAHLHHWVYVYRKR